VWRRELGKAGGVGGVSRPQLRRRRPKEG